MKKPPYANSCSRIWFLLSQTRHTIFKLRQWELGNLNLLNIEAGLLIIVDSLDPGEARPSNISQFFLREPYAVFQFLTRMEKKIPHTSIITVLCSPRFRWFQNSKDEYILFE